VQWVSYNKGRLRLGCHFTQRSYLTDNSITRYAVRTALPPLIGRQMRARTSPRYGYLAPAVCSAACAVALLRGVQGIAITNAPQLCSRPPRRGAVRATRYREFPGRCRGNVRTIPAIPYGEPEHH
jgi:hypothetical protein